MTDRLKRLADWIESIDAIPTNDANLREIAALLRAASAETVGTEWTQHSHPFMSEARGDHNRDLAAARLAVADARKERDEARQMAYMIHPVDDRNPGVSWREAYEILDEKSLGEKHGHACAMTTLTEERDALQRAIDEVTNEYDLWLKAVDYRGATSTLSAIIDILRPHATRREEATQGQKLTASHFTEAETERAIDDICAKVAANRPATVAENATPARQWSSTPPSDRSGKWWHACHSVGCSPELLLVPLECGWSLALTRSSVYNLWLPHLDGDTRDTLPPLPTETNPTSHYDDDERNVPPAPADDTRELVARLAECVRDHIAEYINADAAPGLNAIIADARRGCGA